MRNGAKKTFIKCCLLWLLMFLALTPNSTFAIEKLFFKESTFTKFIYPDGVYSEQYTELIRTRMQKAFPRATLLKVASYITRDNSRTVVNYYAQLSGQRFFKQGDRFFYVFSEINGQPASRIEIQPIPVAKMQPSMWPTRIDLVIVSYPIKVANTKELNRSIDDLRKKVGKLCYTNGVLREDVAQIEMEDLGPTAEVWVVATRDPFNKVYTFFRRRYGRIGYLPARDGEIYTRDFEIDATRAVGLNRKEQELHIRVEENPMVTDNAGNSQVYMGYTFIQYTFWRNNHN